MEKIYEEASQVHVASVIIYPGSGTAAGKYYDTAAKATAAEAKTELSGAELLQLFAKGVLVDNGTTLVRPIACTRAGVLTLPTLS